MKPTLFLLIALWPLPSPTAREIPWRADYGATLIAAAEQKQVVFLAVNMDGERANDRLAKDVYRDPAVVELAARTLPLVASAFSHGAEGRPCARFGTVTCREHQSVEMDARRQVLEPDERDFVVAPQHVFLGPDGKVLLSVPYEITAEELEWCLATALLAVDPASDVRPSRRARAPKRLIRGAVFSGAAASEAAPASREEALELVARLKRGGLAWNDQLLAIRRLATADEKEAREYILSLLRMGPLGMGRGGGRGGGGGGGQQDWRGLLLRWVGYASPPSYWEVCAEFLGSGERELRLEAIVALEQLGAPEALSLLQAQLRREKEPIATKKLLRAIGTSGRDDRNARTALVKQAGHTRSPLLAANALIALGSLTTHADVQVTLRDALKGPDARLAGAAALGIAFARDRDGLELLREVLGAEPDPELRPVLEAAVAVIEGAPLARLRESIERIAEDTIPRPRYYGWERQGP